MKNFITVGQFGAVHGLQGWLKLHSYTDPEDNIFSYHPWWWSTNPASNPILLSLEDTRRHHGSLLVKLKGCDNPDAARRYVNGTIVIEASQLPALAEGEYYWQDLVGFRVMNHQDKELGVVKRLIATGANDVLVVQRSEDGKEVLIPYVLDHVIKQIKPSEKLIVVDWDPSWD